MGPSPEATGATRPDAHRSRRLRKKKQCRESSASNGRRNDPARQAKPARPGSKIERGAILLAACLAWPSPGAAQLVEAADWSIPARPDWRTEVRYFDNPLCLMWSNGEDKCERDPETMKARCTIAPELRMEPYTVTCRIQNRELIMSFCDEWGVAGSAWCSPKRCMPGIPSRTIKFAPGINCIKWKKN